MRAALFLIAIIVATHLSANNGANEKKPNVIIIMTDDQGYADMSCNGNFPLFVEAPGEYTIELRRWPKETARAINAYKGLGGRVPIKEFRDDAVQLMPEGDTELQTWFIDSDGTERTAYWIYLKKSRE